MIVTQKIHLFLIVIPGVILGITVILLKKDIGLWLMRYGLIIAIPGVLLSVLTDKKLLDVLLLIDTGGFGRAYIAGCMLLLAGMIVQGWRTIIDLKNQNTSNK